MLYNLGSLYNQYISKKQAVEKTTVMNYFTYDLEANTSCTLICNRHLWIYYTKYKKL